MSNNQEAGRLTGKTWIPLGAAVSAVVTLIGFQLWIGQTMNQITTELRLIRQDLSRSWTKAEMGAWAYQLRDRNDSSLKVPDPSQVKTP